MVTSFLPLGAILAASTVFAVPLLQERASTNYIVQELDGWQYKKCIVRSMYSPREGWSQQGSANTVSQCLTLCTDNGVENCFLNEDRCYTGPGELSPASFPDAHPPYCELNSCQSDSTQACGQLYAALSPPAPSSTEVTTTTLAVTPTDAPTATSTSISTDDSAISVGSFTVSNVATQPTATSTKLLTDENWNYKGCYTDLREIRSLKIILNQGGRWDVEHCLDAARAEGFLYAGLITGGECWGANEIDTVTKRQDASKCMRPCNDDNNYTCGGLKGLDVYSTTRSKKLLDNPDWQYNGCFSDSIEPNRSLQNLIIRDGGWTVGTCLAAAEIKGYSFAALDIGGECWGGYALSATALPLAADRCNHKCNDEERHCDGDWAIDVYSFIPATQDDDE
ncbi:hypothetical protein JCM8547_004040 [Rhodosporidiobolus lusitaniae]